jgi:murE/murF fusion protein
MQSASIGTLGILSKKYNKKTNLTSIDPISLHKSLEILKKNRVKNVILEASSHGLAQKRLDSLNINVGIFTNFSHDHLDYHKNMKSYLKAKMYLFNNLLKRNSKIIADEEIKEFKFIKDISIKRKIKRITIGQKYGNIKILNNKFKKNIQVVKISINSKIFILKIPLIGFFQVKNLIMAILAASCCGLNVIKIFKKLNKIKSVPGRLESVVNLNNNSNIIVDFAHTPSELENIIV